MTRRIILRPRAQRDLRSAFRRYESQRRGLGTEFLTTVGEQLEKIRDFPHAHQIVHRTIRRAVVSRFPYLIFYVTNADRVDVIAVLHHARNPAGWPPG